MAPQAPGCGHTPPRLTERANKGPGSPSCSGDSRPELPQVDDRGDVLVVTSGGFMGFDGGLWCLRGDE